MQNPLVSIVLLTFRRPQEIERNVKNLLTIDYDPIEIIIVNNGDVEDLRELPFDDKRLLVLNLESNIGVGARNKGIRASSGPFVVTLDDDVFDFNAESIQIALKRFSVDPDLCAINFKIVDDLTEQQVNWIHHKKIEEFHNVEFETYEISEGAVIFRKDLILNTKLYPDFFFISHEGPDLALQIMKTGATIIYCHSIIVRHSHAEGGRLNWRRYYYDTRNQIWLAARHYPVSIAIRKLFVGMGSMLAYSIRDGFLRYYFKGIIDGLCGLKSVVEQRAALSGEARNRYLAIEKENPSIWYMFKKRIFTRKVRI